MDSSIRKLLGLMDEGKRVFRFEDGQVTKDEFDYCQLLDQMVFGENGLVATLGPTWAMIHDPRFSRIENAFIINRRAVFGGDAKVGKQYISSDGQFTSTIADLEQYSEVLGEGRHFHNVLVHPDATCRVRRWLERIHTATDVTAAPDLTCTCTQDALLDPKELYNQSDEYLWRLIRQECPNYWTQMGTPNAVAKRLFDLFRADLVGLVTDYSITPLIDEWLMLETGDVVEENTYTRPEDEVPPRVFAEVDLLEKALTYRASMRCTAAKILRQISFQRILKEMGGIRLTDIERDELLRLVYNPPQYYNGLKVDIENNYYGYLHMLKDILREYLAKIQLSGKDFEQRQREQLARASEQSMAMVRGLVDGSVASINQYTEPVIQVTQDEQAKVIEAIMSHPLKQELFIIWTDAEKRGVQGVAELLDPVFATAEYDLSPEKFCDLLEEVKKLGYYQRKLTLVDETYDIYADGVGD